MKKQSKYFFNPLGLKALVLAGACTLSSQVLASEAYIDRHYTVKQPDGSTLEIVLNGTTHYADQRTVDGYPLIYDQKTHGYSYAKLSVDGQKFVSSGILAIKANDRLRQQLARDIDIPQQTKLLLGKRSALALKSEIHSLHHDSKQSEAQLLQQLALTGNVKGLTILIQFPDVAGTISQGEVTNYANQVGYNGYGNSQSIRDYFSEVSGGKLTYTNTVTRYYTAKNNKSYYTNPNIGFGTRAQELIREALQWLDSSQGFDFSTLSTDSNGGIKGLNVFYAGETDGGWSQGLWPHMGGLSQNFCADNVCATQYQITNMSNALSIGTFIHESGHLIGGWPDLYDYDGSSNGSVATFCVMGYGSLGAGRPQKPLPPNGYFRHLAGWETVTELNPAVNVNAPVGLISHQANSNTMYRWSNPNKAGEAFYLEARIKQGQNEYLPDEGLAIWHVDGDGDNSTEWHPYVQMEHADGARQPENNINRGDEYDLYDASGQTSFGYASPNNGTYHSTNSRWWNGADSGLSITQIGAVNSTLTFDIGGDVTEPEPTLLVNNATTSVPNLVSGQRATYRLEVPADASKVTFTLTGSNGDADLYVKKGEIATETVNDCKSTGSSSNESCNVTTSSGTYYATVYAYAGFSGLQIKGAYTVSSSNTQRYTGNLSGANDKDIQPDGSYFQTAGGTLIGVLAGPSNADFDLKLYKWSNSQWTEVAASTAPNSAERIEYTAVSGYYRFEIYSYSGSGNYTFDLTQ